MTTPPQSGPSWRTQTWTGAGLLEQIADSALDDDYYVFRGSEPRRSPATTAVVAVLLTLFTLFVTTAAVQTRNDRPATELERRTLASDIEERQETLDERRAVAAGLSAEVQSLRRAAGDDEEDGSADVDLLAAASAVRGPGVVFTADGARSELQDARISDRDLQVLVNGLWYAGAEAVAVNGQRIGTTTSIRTAGDAITVNFRSIGPPYRVVALGDPESLQTRFAQNPAGSYWENRRKRAGVGLTMSPSSEVELPAAPAKRLDLAHATSLEEDR